MAVFLLLTDENQYSTIFAGEWGEKLEEKWQRHK